MVIVKIISDDVKVKIKSEKKGSRTMFNIMLNDVKFGKTSYARKYDAIAQAKKYIEYYGNEKLVDMYKKYIGKYDR